MDIVINLDRIVDLLTQSPDVLFIKFVLYIGWIPIVVVILWGIFQIWLDSYVRGIYASKREFILLAIDVPTGNEQTPKAVEQMFAHFAGAHGSINLIEFYWHGKTQDSFSLEIVSIEGYTQFIIRTQPEYKDLIESMVYAQYPDAEITEVEDYVHRAPDDYPDDNYKIWGAEWILTRPDVYPIKQYIEFEDKNTGDFKDPMAALMELYSGLRKGEQCWYQIIVTPTGFAWEADGPKEISKIIGEKIVSSKNFIDKSVDFFINILGEFSELIIPLWGDIKSKDDDQQDSFKMMNLKPIQKKQIEAIQQKISKMAFEIKIRFIYIAEKEVFGRSRINSFVGVMKQFAAEDLNGFKPDMNTTATTASYIMKDSRLNTKRRRLMRAYKSRSNWMGKNKYILNIEELATIWHFPLEEAVKAPLLQKVMSRKSEAPSYLPVEGGTSDLNSDILESGDEERDEIFAPAVSVSDDATQDEPQVEGPPSNLPTG